MSIRASYLFTALFGLLGVSILKLVPDPKIPVPTAGVVILLSVALVCWVVSCGALFGVVRKRPEEPSSRILRFNHAQRHGIVMDTRELLNSGCPTEGSARRHLAYKYMVFTTLQSGATDLATRNLEEQRRLSFAQVLFLLSLLFVGISLTMYTLESRSVSAAPQVQQGGQKP
jgi:hypothetical protein